MYAAGNEDGQAGQRRRWMLRVDRRLEEDRVVLGIDCANVGTPLGLGSRVAKPVRVRTQHHGGATQAR